MTDCGGVTLSRYDNKPRKPGHMIAGLLARASAKEVEEQLLQLEKLSLSALDGAQHRRGMGL